MPKICAYIITHDTGYAPKIKKGRCILERCKKTTIEKSAQKDDWIIAFGGRKLGKTKGNRNKYYRKLIYAMKVQEIKPPSSKDFSFFGENAKDLTKKSSEKNLLDYIFRTNWCHVKYFKDETDFIRIETFINQLPRNKIGEHCDLPEKENKCKKC